MGVSRRCLAVSDGQQLFSDSSSVLRFQLTKIYSLNRSAARQAPVLPTVEAPRTRRCRRRWSGVITRNRCLASRSAALAMMVHPAGMQATARLPSCFLSPVSRHSSSGVSRGLCARPMQFWKIMNLKLINHSQESRHVVQ